jgi:hypothetical protein
MFPDGSELSFEDGVTLGMTVCGSATFPYYEPFDHMDCLVKSDSDHPIRK